MNDPNFVSVFDRFSGPVVLLMSYGQHKNQTLQPDGNNRVHDNVWDVTKFLKETEKDGLSAPSSKI